MSPSCVSWMPVCFIKFRTVRALWLRQIWLAIQRQKGPNLKFRKSLHTSSMPILFELSLGILLLCNSFFFCHLVLPACPFIWHFQISWKILFPSAFTSSFSLFSCYYVNLIIQNSWHHRPFTLINLLLTVFLLQSLSWEGINTSPWIPRWPQWFFQQHLLLMCLSRQVSIA